MSLPRLEGWQDHPTRDALHQAMQVLRSARKAGVARQPNYLHLATLPERRGASSGPLSLGGSLHLDYARAALTWHVDGVEHFSVDLAGRSQRTLFETVFAQLRDLGHDHFAPDMAKVTRDEPLEVERGPAEAYAEAQWRMFEALARMKAHLLGHQTPLVVWPHGFDLATLWFAQGKDEERDPHLSVGFSPGTPDIGEPYVYAYAWPAVDGLAAHLPAPFEWVATWSTPGSVLRWSRIRSERDPVAYVAEMLVAIYRTTATELKRSSIATQEQA
jgi:hypothetical protein